MTTERDLIQRMADELDHYRQLLMDDLRETHALANEARAYLAQSESEGPTDEDMNDLADDLLGIVLPEGSGARLISRALELWGRPAIKPVPVTERLPGPEDTTDRNECWYWHPGEECWEMVPVVTHTVDEWTHWLPHHALPVPQP